MATIGVNTLTLAEWAKRLDPNGKVDKIIELMSQTNEVLQDMMYVEGNLPTGHRTTVRTDLPSVAWRKLNYGVQPSKSKTKQVDDQCGMLEAYSEVDKKLCELNGNKSSFRLSEDRPFLESMNQEFAKTFFYGDTDVSPEKFLGLGPRYPYKDSPNVIDFGDSGDHCTSIWLAVWGDNTVHGAFPKGSKAGFSQQDLGEVTLEDADGGLYQGYRTHFKWEAGLVVRDWRYVVRICNIDTTDFTSDELIKAMITAMHKVPSLKMGRPCWYMNKTIMTALDIEAAYKTNVYFTVSEDPGGEMVTRFRKIPIRQVDAILDTETALTATP
jgi:hypothetical protein